jgi:hypothetical protein
MTHGLQRPSSRSCRVCNLVAESLGILQGAVPVWHQPWVAGTSVLIYLSTVSGAGLLAKDFTRVPASSGSKELGI